jgi:hypothetical protein
MLISSDRTLRRSTEVPALDGASDKLAWPSDEERAAMTIEDWRQFFARQRYREYDATLIALQAAATALNPPCTALCSLSGNAHGYALQFTVLQFAGPTFARYSWDATAQQFADPQPVNLNLDLRAEFQRLQHEPIVLRGEGNRNIDRQSGVEGRTAAMFLIVGSDAEWIEFSSPLLGGMYPNTAINRIFREMTGLQQSMTLIDEMEPEHS